MPVDLEEYRAEADRFLAELYLEEYLQLSGQKDEYEIEAIYDRHADLTSPSACRELEQADGRELWRFACEGLLGARVAFLREQVAKLEATLEAPVGGTMIPYRMLRPAMANEPDRARRQELQQARLELVEQINPVYEEILDVLGDALGELGGGTYRALYERFGFPLEELRSQCERFLADTEALHVERLDRVLRSRLGIGLEEAGTWDVPRLLRSDRWDEGFPAERLLPALEATLGELGIDLRRQPNVELDLEPRPNKDPRAFCAPIEVPGRVVLCIKPIGGVDDWRALFHEAGHTEHFAHTSARLPFEARRLGDNAVTEGWAFLLEHLVTDPAWLSRRLDFARPEDFTGESAAIRLLFTRRYCAKLLYELELYGGAPLEAMPARYAELLTDATKLRYAEQDYLGDVDAGFYVTSYLRAWALEAGLRAHLRERFGGAWFASRKAGSLLRELWSEGQGLDADTILAELTGARLELASVADELRGG